MRLLANRVRRGGDKGSRTLDTGSRDALQGVTEDRQHPRASVGAFPGAAGLEERRRGSLRRRGVEPASDPGALRRPRVPTHLEFLVAGVSCLGGACLSVSRGQAAGRLVGPWVAACQGEEP